jgi:HrpA-like RNA helicase
MSATVEASRFSNYFGNCPVVSVPGRTYPVHVQYLEDVLEDTGKHNLNNHHKRLLTKSTRLCTGRRFSFRRQTRSSKNRYNNA